MSDESVFDDVRESLNERISKLVDENKRLREALEALADAVEYKLGVYHESPYLEAARAALAGGSDGN